MYSLFLHRYPKLSFEELESRLLPTTVYALGVSGINYLGLEVTGRNVSIGQIELGRPQISVTFGHPQVVPTDVYDLDQQAEDTAGTQRWGNHATKVASI